MEAKHTPGQWSFTKGSSWVNKDGIAIANVFGRTTVEQESNLKLIAAAPEMFKALQAAKAVLDCQGINENNSVASPQYKQIVQAIKKAT